MNMPQLIVQFNGAFHFVEKPGEFGKAEAKRGSEHDPSMGPCAASMVISPAKLHAKDPTPCFAGDRGFGQALPAKYWYSLDFDKSEGVPLRWKMRPSRSQNQP
jgi:hypothetical protein